MSSLHVHFSPNQHSGSHRPPEEFSKTLRNIWKSVRNTVQTPVQGVIDCILGNSYMRQEVPFERWFFHFGKDAAISSAEVKAHCWALFTLMEGSARTIVDTISYLFAKCTGNSEEQKQLDILKAQATGVALSAVAVVAPHHAVHLVNNTEKPLIGSLASEFSWGTRYQGEGNWGNIPRE